MLADNQDNAINCQGVSGKYGNSGFGLTGKRGMRADTIHWERIDDPGFIPTDTFD